MTPSSPASQLPRPSDRIEIVCERPLPAWMHVALLGCIVLLIVGLSLFQIAFPKIAASKSAPVTDERPMHSMERR